MTSKYGSSRCWKDCVRPSAGGPLPAKGRERPQKTPMLTRRTLLHTARTLLVPVFLMGGLMEVASAQHKYIFPQFAFGGGLGIDPDGAGVG